MLLDFSAHGIREAAERLDSQRSWRLSESSSVKVVDISGVDDLGCGAVGRGLGCLLDDISNDLLLVGHHFRASVREDTAPVRLVSAVGDHIEHFLVDLLVCREAPD